MQAHRMLCLDLARALTFGALLLITTSVAGAQPAAVPSPLSLGQAVARALEANPALAAARLRRSIDAAGIGLARERPYSEARVELERETPTRAYSLAVPWEAGGKRGRRIDVSEAVGRTGEAEIAQRELDIRVAVRRAFFDRVVADARLVVLDEIATIARRVRDAAQQRFDAGSAPRLEVVQADLALAQTANESTAARGASDAARVQLNALLALPLDAPTRLAASLDEGPALAVDAAVARAQAASAELAVLDRRIDEQKARVALARALQVPDVSLEGALTRGAEPEFSTGWRAALAVGVPIFSRHRAGARFEETTLSQLGLERAATSSRVAADVSAAMAEADARRQQYRRYRDEILPKALEMERMAGDAYRLGQTGISALFLALQASGDARLRSLEAGAAFQSAIADLERAIGAPLP